MKHIRKFNEVNISIKDLSSRAVIEGETLEEAAEREYPEKHAKDILSIIKQEAFINGAQWQQQRSHSEEEVLELLLKMNEWPTTFDGEEEVKEWFEQFKK